MERYETQVQNVTVKTLKLRNFAVSHIPAFKICYVTTIDIFDEIVVPFNHLNYCLTTFENTSECFGYLSVADYEFRFESDEIESLYGFLGLSLPEKHTALALES